MLISHRTPLIRWCTIGPLSLLLLAAGCGPDENAGGRAGRIVPAVEAVRARYGALPLTERLSGVVRAKNQVAIYPQVSAIVTAVPVHNGDAVTRGQVLVRLRDTEFRERLAQAQASYQIAAAQLKRAEAVAKETRAELERYRSLAEGDLASAAELESAEAAATSAEADVDLARARLEQARAAAGEQEENLTQTVIRSPITGSVGNRNAEVGMLATPGTRLFTVGQLDSVRVDVVLTDRMVHYIEEGHRTEISVAGRTVSARLSRISPFLDPVSHSTDAEIDMAAPGDLLRPGMFVTVDVFYGESENATLVPLSALYEDPATGQLGLYVTGDSLRPAPAENPSAGAAPLVGPVSFRFVPVEVIAEGRMEAAVRGADEGDWVVTMGQNLLGGLTSEARVRPVDWERVERFQRLQREDLMDEVIRRRTPQ